MASVQGANGFQLTTSTTVLQACELPALAPGPDEVVIEVAGCGVCHTDIGFAFDGVPTRHALPLVLGHEISGRVVATGENSSSWFGSPVIVPAVIPCGSCPACMAGRPTICRRQFMPGNDGDGGFATHVLVPSRGLCAVPETLRSGLTLEMLYPGSLWHIVQNKRACLGGHGHTPWEGPYYRTNIARMLGPLCSLARAEARRATRPSHRLNEGKVDLICQRRQSPADI